MRLRTISYPSPDLYTHTHITSVHFHHNIIDAHVLDLHVGPDGSTSKQSSSANGTSGHGSGILGRAAAGLRVTGGVLAQASGVRGVAAGDGNDLSGQSSVGGSRRRNTGSVRNVAAGRGTRVGVGGLVVGLGAVCGCGVVGGQDGVEDVQDTVGEQDVGGDDAGAVHEDFTVDDGDGDVVAAEGGNCAVGQRAAVGDGAVDDVVLQDRGGFFGGQVGEGGADVLEGGVVWCEDGQIGGGCDGFGEAGCVDGTEEGAETGFLSDGADVRREGEQTIDNVDHSTIEGNVLVVLLVYIQVGLNQSESTYSFSNRDIVLESRDHNDLAVAYTAFDNLTTSDIGKGSVVEQSSGEGRSLCDVLRAELANENVVVEKSLEEALLAGRGQYTGAVQCVQSIVGRSQQCNVLGASECGCKIRLALQQADEGGQVLVAGEDRGEVGGAGVFLSSSSNDCSCSEEGLSELHDEYA